MLIVIPDLAFGLVYDDSAAQFPTRVWQTNCERLRMGCPGSRFFGYVATGSAQVHLPTDQKVQLGAGAYFVLNDRVDILPGMSGSKVVIIERLNQSGLTLVGGPIERQGRLRYIDGCTDSLLIPPTLYGDACLNHLHFPKGVAQTAHTHPSIRCGSVARGRGRCVTPEAVTPLEAGMTWVIPAEAVHSFFTDGLNGETMDIIAYHPDSDFGPKHEDHPMVNRTFVGGVSAASPELNRIRTGESALRTP